MRRTGFRRLPADLILADEIYVVRPGKGKGKDRVLAIALLTWVRLATKSAFTISEVAADWHELMIPQRTMRPSIACVSEQLDPRFESTLTTRARAPIQARRCEQLAQSCYLVAQSPGIKLATSRSWIQRPNHWAIKPPWWNPEATPWNLISAASSCKYGCRGAANTTPCISLSRCCTSCLQQTSHSTLTS